MGAYYYAGGRKVELEADPEHIAVDQQAALQAGLDTEVIASRAGLPRAGSRFLLAQRSEVREDMLESLRKAGALQPVYRRNQAVIVALPEVRIELDNPNQRRAVMNALAKRRSQLAITDETDDRLVIRPTSGRGEDALEIANYIYERAHPAAASVRFVQLVPKPAVLRS